MNFQIQYFIQLLFPDSVNFLISLDYYNIKIMKYFSAIAVLALVSSQASALQLHDDIMLPEEEELFLQLAASAEN